MRFLALLISIAMLLSFVGCNTDGGGDNSGNVGECGSHTDIDDNGSCDACGDSVLVTVDFYVINDLHGKFADTDAQPGVDELTTYLKNSVKSDEHAVLLSTGDMWQGSSESNLTYGNIITDWMNEMDFAAMALGNHEFDWGEEYIAANAAIAEFPFLAINIYDRETNQRVEYASASVMVECGDIDIGIIGAIGDCYSSISYEQVSDIYFKTGDELTALVKSEADRLREGGAEIIVYSLHDGHENGGGSYISSGELSDYYDPSLSNGYVDIVFEGHTHQSYVLSDSYGVTHLQSGGENRGISHAEIVVNSANGGSAVMDARTVPASAYRLMEDDPIVEELLEKYREKIDFATEKIGYNSRWRSSTELRSLVADLYYGIGCEVWGDEYDIVLGGGFISVRSPYELEVGDVTYADLQMLFPFDNRLVLCSVKGSDLREKFFETDNSNYYVSYDDYGDGVRKNIEENKTYYIIVDTYTSSYSWNNLTVVDYYTDGVYARDLLAEYISLGGLE